MNIKSIYVLRYLNNLLININYINFAFILNFFGLFRLCESLKNYADKLSEI